MREKKISLLSFPWESIAIFVFSFLVSSLVWMKLNDGAVTCFLKHTPSGCHKGETLLGYIVSSTLLAPDSLPVVFSVLGALISICVALSGMRLRQEVDDIRLSIDGYREAVFAGLASAGSDSVRVLHYKELEGSLLNTTAADSKNAPRNVLLNNKTVQTILKGLRDRGEAQLEEAGYNAGKDFGEVVVSLQKENLDDLDLLIEEWFRYDSNAGFGNFGKDTYLQPGAYNVIGIRLRYNFLATGGTFKDPNVSLCGFMRGYIRGVISSLPRTTLARFGFSPETITVAHDPRSQNCICTSKNETRGCLFTVTARPLADS